MSLGFCPCADQQPTKCWKRKSVDASSSHGGNPQSPHSCPQPTATSRAGRSSVSSRCKLVSGGLHGGLRSMLFRRDVLRDCGHDCAPHSVRASNSAGTQSAWQALNVHVFWRLPRLSSFLAGFGHVTGLVPSFTLLAGFPGHVVIDLPRETELVEPLQVDSCWSTCHSLVTMLASLFGCFPCFAFSLSVLRRIRFVFKRHRRARWFLLPVQHSDRFFLWLLFGSFSRPSRRLLFPESDREGFFGEKHYHQRLPK